MGPILSKPILSKPILSKPILSKPRWATAAATTAAAAEEFSQAIQAPSPTHPGTTYPVRVSPHSDIYYYIYYIYLIRFACPCGPGFWNQGSWKFPGMQVLKHMCLLCIWRSCFVSFWWFGVHFGGVFEVWRHPGALKGTNETPRAPPGVKRR